MDRQPEKNILVQRLVACLYPLNIPEVVSRKVFCQSANVVCSIPERAVRCATSRSGMIRITQPITTGTNLGICVWGLDSLWRLLVCTADCLWLGLDCGLLSLELISFQPLPLQLTLVGFAQHFGMLFAL